MVRLSEVGYPTLGLNPMSIVVHALTEIPSRKSDSSRERNDLLGFGKCHTSLALVLAILGFIANLTRLIRLEEE